MPLTQNGKVDTKALPKPDGSISTDEEYVAPTNKTEENRITSYNVCYTKLLRRFP